MMPYATAATTHNMSASTQRGVGGTLSGSLGSPPVVGARTGMIGCAMRRAWNGIGAGNGADDQPFHARCTS
jgi:hypothetical protein